MAHPPRPNPKTYSYKTLLALGAVRAGRPGPGVWALAGPDPGSRDRPPRPDPNAGDVLIPGSALRLPSV